MHKNWILVLTAIVICLGATVAQADLIVDTGNPELPFESGLLLKYPEEWIAGKFTLDQAYIITQVQGLIGGWRSDMAGDINAVIRAADPTNQNLPGKILWTASFTPTQYGQFIWQGPDALTWYLTTGSYWLAFEVPSSSNFYGVMKDNAVTPLVEYATSPGTGIYSEYQPNMKTGFRIYADAAAVPVPGALWLMGSGLVGLMGLRRKFSG